MTESNDSVGSYGEDSNPPHNQPESKVTHRRSKIVPDLVRQGELRDLRGNPAVIIHERYDPGVQRSLRALVHPPDRLRVRFVLFAYPPGGTGRRGDPRQPQGAAGEVPVREDVRQAEIFVVSQRVDVQEVADIYVFYAEVIRFATPAGAPARSVVVDLRK